MNRTLLFLMLLVSLNASLPNLARNERVHNSLKKASQICDKRGNCRIITSLRGKYYLRTGQHRDQDWAYKQVGYKMYASHVNTPKTPLLRPAYDYVSGLVLSGRTLGRSQKTLKKALQLCTYNEACKGVTYGKGSFHLKSSKKAHASGQHKVAYSYVKNF